MDSTISVEFGKTQHGWLPVTFRYKDLHLNFAASYVLNDPLEDLYDTVISLNKNNFNRTKWWLEPEAYFFDFKRTKQIVTLTIIHTNDLFAEADEQKKLLVITGNENEIVEPFRVALRKFISQPHEEKHWPHKMQSNKIREL
jgi:hypothetical protein